MNKIIKTLLNDYLEEKTDENLELLAVNINPDFKLTKKKNVQLAKLIEKYEKDKSKVRLDIIINFIGGVKTQTTKKTQKASKNIIPENKNNKKEVPETMLEIQDLQRRYTNLVREYKEEKDKIIKNSLRDDIKNLDQEINTALRKHQLWVKANIDPKAQYNFEKSVVKRLFGDSEDVNSLAYKILNGKAISATVVSEFNPEIMIRKLFAMNGKEPYEYSAGVIGADASGGMTWKIQNGSGDGVAWTQPTTKL